MPHSAPRFKVATVLTVYGIETEFFKLLRRKNTYVATVLTVYGIETVFMIEYALEVGSSCNSPYRLRYAPKGARQQRSEATMRSAHLKYLSEAKVKQR